MNYFIPGSRLPEIIAAQPPNLTLQASAQELLLGLRIRVIGEPTPQPSRTGLLLISNHGTALDLFLIAAVTRQPFYFVGSQLLKGLGGKWRQHIMPIYLAASRVKHFWDWPRKLVWRYRERIADDATAHRHNLAMMAQASQMLKDGQTVLLFPSGRSLRGRWANGVGHLLKSLEGTRVKVAFAHLRPLPWYVHLVEFWPEWVLRRLPIIQTRIKWSELIDLHQVHMKDWEPRQVTKWLKAEYGQQARVGVPG